MQVQMSSDATKKRRVATDGSGGTAAAGMEDIIAEMKVQMTRMQNKMNEMETQIISAQNEIDSTKSRLLQMNELDKKNKYLEARCISLEISVKIIAKDFGIFCTCHSR